MTAQSGQPNRVIWEREIDTDAISGRWRKLGLYYALPTVVALIVALVLGGVGAMLGVLILLGLFGVLLVALVFFKNLNARANRTIALNDGHLVLGQRRVDLARVEAWASNASAEDWGVTDAALFGNPMAGNAITAQVFFRLAQYDDSGQRGVRIDGGPAFEVVEFAWAEMPPDQLQRVCAALAPHVAAPQVRIDQLRA